MSNNIYGYIRVSTKDQNEDRQRIAMQEAGYRYYTGEDLYREKL